MVWGVSSDAGKFARFSDRFEVINFSRRGKCLVAMVMLAASPATNPRNIESGNKMVVVEKNPNEPPHSKQRAT
jgi:hypothetical protein